MSIKLQRSIPATPVNIFIFPELAHTQRSLLNQCTSWLQGPFLLYFSNILKYQRNIPTIFLSECELIWDPLLAFLFLSFHFFSLPLSSYQNPQGRDKCSQSWGTAGTDIIEGNALQCQPHPMVGRKYFIALYSIQEHEHFQVPVEKDWKVKSKFKGVLLDSSEQSQLVGLQSSIAVLRQGCNSSTLKMTSGQYSVF